MPQRRKGGPVTNQNKSGLRNGLLFIVVFVGTFYAVFHGQNIDQLREAFSRCRVEWLAWAALSVLLFILCESTSLWVLLKSFGMRLGNWTCFLSADVGFFFAAITPSSSGGQPMQVYYLRKKGIPVSVSSMALIVMTTAYKIALMVIGIGLLLFGREFLKNNLGGMMFLYYIGLVLTGAWTAFLLMIIFRPGMARAILVWGMSVLEELHIMKRREERQTSFEIAMETYSDAAAHLKAHPALMLQILGLMFLRRGFLFTVTWCVYNALGLTGSTWMTIILLQASISICADMLPLPGSMGISEGLFIKTFSNVFGALALPGMVLSRGIGHYAQLIFCGIFTVFSLFRLERI